MKDSQYVPFALRSCATEDENEVVDGHIYDFLQCDAMLVSCFFEVSHVFEAPFRNLGGENFLIEGFIGLCRVFPVDPERSIDRNKAVFGQNAGRHLRDAIGDIDRRDLEQIDDEYRVIEPILGVGPSLGRGQIDLYRIGNIGVVVISAFLLDRLEHVDVVVGRLKLQLWKMRREIV